MSDKRYWVCVDDPFERDPFTSCEQTWKHLWCSTLAEANTAYVTAVLQDQEASLNKITTRGNAYCLRATDNKISCPYLARMTHSRRRV